MSKITNDDLTWSGTGCFIAVSIWQQWVSKVHVIHNWLLNTTVIVMHVLLYLHVQGIVICCEILCSFISQCSCAAFNSADYITEVIGFNVAPLLLRVCDQPFDVHCCHMGTAIKHLVPEQVKPSFVIFDIWAL